MDPVSRPVGEQVGGSEVWPTLNHCNSWMGGNADGSKTQDSASEVSTLVCDEGGLLFRCGGYTGSGGWLGWTTGNQQGENRVVLPQLDPLGQLSSLNNRLYPNNRHRIRWEEKKQSGRHQCHLVRDGPESQDQFTVTTGDQSLQGPTM